MKSEDNIYYLMINFDYQKLKIIININKIEKIKNKKIKSFASLGVGSLLSGCLTSFKHVKKLVNFFNHSLHTFYIYIYIYIFYDGS